MIALFLPCRIRLIFVILDALCIELYKYDAGSESFQSSESSGNDGLDEDDALRQDADQAEEPVLNLGRSHKHSQHFAFFKPKMFVCRKIEIQDQKLEET